MEHIPENNIPHAPRDSHMLRHVDKIYFAVERGFPAKRQVDQPVQQRDIAGMHGVRARLKQIQRLSLQHQQRLLGLVYH